MTYDFDALITRRGTGCYKWDLSDDQNSLPMWVADMDFATAPCVVDAVQTRASHGVFGYTKPTERYFNAIVNWYAKRYQFDVSAEWIIPTLGVVPALSAIINAVAGQGDGIIVQTPVYHCFFSSIQNMGCKVIENPLVNNDGNYSMDFEHLESLAKVPSNKAIILCHPHNPSGRAWNKQELEKLGEICLKHNVVVISDEIHSDLVFSEAQHHCFGSLSEELLDITITCQSPSKSFNIAGLQIANVLVSNPNLREKVMQSMMKHEIHHVNTLGVEALIAAYESGAAWLDQLKSYIEQNYQRLTDFVSEELPNLKVTRLEATYLVWIDCRSLGKTCHELDEILRREGHLILNMGDMYGSNGDGFVRMNIACPTSTLLDGLSRLKKALLSI